MLGSSEPDACVVVGVVSVECGIVHAVAMGKPTSLDEAMDDERVNDVDDDDDDHDDDDDGIFAYLCLMVAQPV